ncbi:MAG: hypothetical protein U0794_10425 [Isosphaeraceae bacterium]
MSSDFAGESPPDSDPGDDEPADPADASLTICAECVYFYNVTPSLNAMPLALCTNPRFARPARLDLVTGRTLNETRPRCETINDGHCPGFVKDNSRIVLLVVAAIIIAFVYWFSLSPVTLPPVR